MILVSLASDNVYLTASANAFHCLLVPCSSHVIVTVLSHSVPQDGRTALTKASSSGHTAVVQLLISSGAQVDLQNKVRHNISYSRTLVKGHS